MQRLNWTTRFARVESRASLSLSESGSLLAYDVVGRVIPEEGPYRDRFIGEDRGEERPRDGAAGKRGMNVAFFFYLSSLSLPSLLLY